MNAFQPRPGLMVYASEDRPLILDHEIGKGGEGSVWAISGGASFAAKFYHNGLSFEQARKLDVMCRLKSDSLLRIAAWPTAVLRATPVGQPLGMLMPRISKFQPVHLLYTPKSRRTAFPQAQFPFIVHTSTNIARAFATVHDAGQVIGDVNHGNLLVSDDGRVAFIDCDSFEIHENGSCFPCRVGVPTYTPPELQGKSFQDTRRTAQHDAFGLAVLLFHMLFLGRHPFAGIFRQGSVDKTIEDAIREFRFAYLPDRRLTEMEPPPAVPRLAEFPPDIAGLFVRVFAREGASGRRPTAREWIAPLEALSRNLKRCTASDSHHYYQALTSCPWCRMEKAFGRPMFGIKFTALSGPDFDLALVWAQIEAIQPDEKAAPVFGNAYLDQCTPDPRISSIKAQRRNKRGLSIASILLAVVIVAPGQIPAIGTIFILLLGLILMAHFWGSGNACGDEFKAEYKQCSRNFDAAMQRWKNVEHAPESFRTIKRTLQAQKDELVSIPALRAHRIAGLHAALRQKQLIRFLERHRIEHATIPGIGPGRKDLLRCYGIEDASDISIRLDVKGFGPALKSALLTWRASIEHQFVFNPAEGIDLADIRALDHELAQKRAMLVGSLAAGPQKLRQALLPWQLERASAIEHVNQCARVLTQAQINLRGLG